VKKGTIANLVRLADDDGNGTIEWDEFSKIFEVAAKCGVAPVKEAKGDIAARP